MVKTFKADIVFLVDTSSSVGSLHFRSQKQFVKSMAKSLNVAPEKSRAAIVTYGASSDRSDMHASLSTFEEAVDSSRYIRGRRRTHLAVNDADSLLQASRPDAQKVVVLLSAGRESSSQDIATLKQSFRTLRGSGTKIFVIAIGSNYNEEDFFPAVERFEDIFTVSSFDTLVSQAWLTSKSIAERTGTPLHTFERRGDGGGGGARFWYGSWKCERSDRFRRKQHCSKKAPDERKE